MLQAQKYCKNLLHVLTIIFRIFCHLVCLDAMKSVMKSVIKPREIIREGFLLKEY